LAAETSVVFDGVTRTHRTSSGEVQALRDVTASLPGGVVAVVGPSGSGKSSLLRLIAGIDRPTRGSVVVDGRDVGHASPRRGRRLRRDTVGYVYQQPSANFFQDLTVGEHLRLAAGPKEGSTRLMEILSSLEIEHRVDHLPSELSGGEQQRAAFAQALASGARIVVADEPTSELDSASASLVLEHLRGLAVRGVTFVIATHDPAVIRVSSHQLTLDHGRVQGSTAPGRPAANIPSTSSTLGPIRWVGDNALWITPSELPVVRLEGVSMSFGEGPGSVAALSDIFLEAAGGEIVALVGRSGSGKTTLLNIAAGWQRPTRGSVDAPGGDHPTWADVAVLPQRLGLLDELTVRENVEYPARLALKLGERTDLIDDLIEALGLPGLQRRHPKEISLGEQQRTALARALVLTPRLLIADELTAHQDKEWARSMLEVVSGAAAGGTCCLLATHDTTLTTHAQRTVTMSDGRIVDPGRA
jgi:ABC-type lipoprotein export system ATPase subunit